MTLRDLHALRVSLAPVDITTPELDDSEIMATVAAVAVDPSMLTYEELVAAAVAADDEAAWQLMQSVTVLP